MTPQEAFDKAAAGLRSQGFRKSIKPNSSECAYTTIDADGRECHCAVGWLIHDLLPPNIRFLGLNSLPVTELVAGTGGDRTVRDLIKKRLEGLDQNFLCDLQWAHDGCADDTMYNTLGALALLYGLDAMALGEAP